MVQIGVRLSTRVIIGFLVCKIVEGRDVGWIETGASGVVCKRGTLEKNCSFGCGGLGNRRKGRNQISSFRSKESELYDALT